MLCKEIKYNHVMTLSDYPSEQHLKYLQRNPVIKYQLAEQNSSRQFSENILAVRLFFNEMSYIHISESPKTTFTELAGSIGGQLGLFLGVSLMSLVEIFEFIFMSIYVLIE